MGRHGVALFALARGLRHRAGTTLLVLVVALLATAAAAIGPTYYASARTSILRDSLANATVLERGIEVIQQGLISNTLNPLIATVDAAIAKGIPDQQSRARLFEPAIDSITGTTFFSDLAENPVLGWRSDFCAHLRIVSGTCATTTDQVIISSSLAKQNHWVIGEQLHPPGWPALTVTGVYTVIDPTEPYWFGNISSYFPTEYAAGNAAISSGTPADALFTPRGTLETATGDPQGSVMVAQLVNIATVDGADLTKLVNTVKILGYQLSLDPSSPSISSLIPTIADSIHAGWHGLSVPIFLITIQLLVLVWMLMFLVIRDSIDARGAEVALMRLRGRRGVRLLLFALAEPIALLAIALPLGVGVGGLVCSLLDHALLRPGTPVTTPALTWAAATAAAFGGLLATLIGGWRTLRRSVVDQWEHASREATSRSWVLDAVVATAAVAGVVELLTSSHVDSVKQGSVSLLVPGLIGLATAIVVSRALPAVCRRLFGVTRRHGGLGPFLAVRHVARRTQGIRTTIILATAFALGTFAIASWSIGGSNRAYVAAVGVGAPTALTVVAPPHTDLGAIVDRLDPSGTKAVVVDSFQENGAAILAVDPQRFAAVAEWRSDFSSQSVGMLAKKLAPIAAPPVTLTGDEIRVGIDVGAVSTPGLVLSALLASPEADGPLFNEIGPIPAAHTTATITARLNGCPCQLDSLSIAPSVTGSEGNQITGAVTIESIQVRGPSGWMAVPNVTQPHQWRLGVAGEAGSGAGLTQTATGLVWPLDFVDHTSSVLTVADRPDPLPALVNSALPGVSGTHQLVVTGLDDNSLRIEPITVTSTLPGTLSGVAIVDRTYAERAASGVLSGLVSTEVWVAKGAAPAITTGLREAGVRITATQTAASVAHGYDRQGPGLASAAFANDAVAAAVLAAAGAVMGLVTAARRRRFEYAALRAAGASARAVYAGLFLEQLAVLLVGALGGAAAGLVAAKLAVSRVPEFVTAPAIRLTYPLPAGVLGIALGAGVGGLVVVAAIASRALLAGAHPDQLREAQE